MNNLSVFNKTVELAANLFDARKSTVAITELKSGKPSPGQKNIKQPFERVTPESQGISSAYIAEFINKLKDDSTLDPHGLIIMRNGKIVAEANFGLQDPSVWKMTFSAAKSVTALAIGVLVDRGALSVTDKVAKFFDAKLSPLSRITVKDLTVEDLLTMRSGILFSEASAMVEAHWQRGFLNSVTSGKMGEDFYYNSLNSYMLAAIVSAITGVSVSEFLRQTVFGPLGIEDFYWETCSEGVEKGGWGLYMYPEDMAKLGQLVIDKGMWKGRRIISDRWIDTMISPHVLTPSEYGNYNYGYHIWVGRKSNSFLFNGMFGQNVLGFPQNGIVIVSNAGNEEVFQSSSFYPLAEKYFGKEFPQALPEEPNEYKKLLNAESDLRLCKYGSDERKLFGFFKRKATADIPRLGELLNGKTFRAKEPCPSFGLMPVTLQATQNNYTKGFKALSFRIGQKGDFYTVFTEEDAVHTLQIGFTKPEDGLLTFNGEPFKVVSYGKFGTDEDGNTVLTLKVAFTETPFTRKLKIRFFKDTDRARIEASEQPGEAYLIDLAQMGLKNLEDVPVLNSIISKTNTDYIEYKVNRIMEPRVDVLETKTADL